MKLKNILLIVSTLLLCSACSSKDEFYRGTYNWIQDDKFCTNQKECDYKRLHSHESNQDTKMSYDEYKNSIEEERY